MKIELNALQARIIGCLIEKQITTPDQYPLSLNALVSACNQKSNREPLMALDELTVQRTVDELTRKHLLLDRSGFGSRVAKYRHCFCNTEFGTLKFDPQELAIVCELLLRGPQTPGELRSRASRMASFTDVSEVGVLDDCRREEVRTSPVWRASPGGVSLHTCLGGLPSGTRSRPRAVRRPQRNVCPRDGFCGVRQEQRLTRLGRRFRAACWLSDLEPPPRKERSDSAEPPLVAAAASNRLPP
jgi:hypothetical protein